MVTALRTSVPGCMRWPLSTPQTRQASRAAPPHLPGQVGMCPTHTESAPLPQQGGVLGCPQCQCKPCCNRQAEERRGLFCQVICCVSSECYGARHCVLRVEGPPWPPQHACGMRPLPLLLPQWTESSSDFLC